MLALLALVAVAQTQLAPVPLDPAPGQEWLFIAHVRDFPKVGWVVVDELPMSDRPQLGGRLLNVLRRGETVEVAGVGGFVARPGHPGALDDVLAVPATVGAPAERRAGYVQARGLAVFETLLGHCSPGVAVFASVLGRQTGAAAGGLVLEVAVWLRRGEGTPSLLLAGLNQAPGPRLLEVPEGGAAVELAGEVVVLAGDGRELWRSPAGEGWLLEGLEPAGFVLSGPTGRHVVALPKTR